MAMLRKDVKAYYVQHGPFTDPGPYGYLYADLPSDLDALCGMVNGLLVHGIWRGMGQLQIPKEREKEAEIRTMQAKLRRIMDMDPRPLAEARPFQERLFGNCRDEALMLCSFLRHVGIPARVRKGFQSNVGPKKLDHAICQSWSEAQGRWLTVDVQMDNMARETDRLPPPAREYLAAITPQDTPPEGYMTGGQAWLKCRSGGDDPMTYGIGEDQYGWWMIQHSLLRDLLALNKLELICWDCIPDSLLNKERADRSAEHLAFLDRVAQATIDVDAALDEVRRLYDGTPSLHVPADWFGT
jgi:hypothetical protein